MLLDDPCAANATDDNAMRKTVANDRIRFMVYLFSLRFEDDAGFDIPITEGDSRGARFIPDRGSAARSLSCALLHESRTPVVEPSTSQSAFASVPN